MGQLRQLQPGIDLTSPTAEVYQSPQPRKTLAFCHLPPHLRDSPNRSSSKHLSQYEACHYSAICPHAIQRRKWQWVDPRAPNGSTRTQFAAQGLVDTPGRPPAETSFYNAGLTALPTAVEASSSRRRSHSTARPARHATHGGPPILKTPRGRAPPQRQRPDRPSPAAGLAQGKRRKQLCRSRVSWSIGPEAVDALQAQLRTATPRAAQNHYPTIRLNPEP